MITLVIGGVRSGKSRWAQDMATKAGNVVCKVVLMVAGCPVVIKEAAGAVR